MRNQKAKGKYQKAKVKNSLPPPFVPEGHRRLSGDFITGSGSERLRALEGRRNNASSVALSGLMRKWGRRFRWLPHQLISVAPPAQNSNYGVAKLWDGAQAAPLAILLCLSLVALASTSCSKKTAAAEPPAVAVKVSTVETTRLSNTARYSATIKPNTQVELAFNLGGYLVQLHQVRGVDGKLRDVQEGDVIAQGTVLARLRQNDHAVRVNQADAQAVEAKAALDASKAQLTEAGSAIAASKAQLAEVEAAYEKARLDLERANTLFASQSLTKPERDAAQAQFDTVHAKRDAASSQVAMYEAKANTANAQIEASRARVEGARARGIEARIPLNDTALKAPLNAVVLQRMVEVGSLIAPGRPGFVLADTSSVKAIFGVPDAMLSKLKLGGFLTLTTEALPGAEFRGQITRIAPAADAQSRVFEVAVTIPNPRQQLRVGMIAALEIAAVAREEVVVVPVSSIIRAKDNSESYAVFVIEERNGQTTARTRTIKPGVALGNTIVVLDGVKPSERVITTGTTLVLDGQAVQVIP